MSKKLVFILMLLIMFPILYYLFWPSDENRIRGLIKEGVSAVEEEKTEDVMSKISFSYSDDNGLSYLLIKRGLERFFSEMADLSVNYTVKSVTVEDNVAAAELSLRVTARIGDESFYIVGDFSEAQQLSLTLKKEGPRWLVVKADGLPKRF